MRPDWELWDPRSGQDYRMPDFKTKQVFSSLKHKLFVIELIGSDLSDQKLRKWLDDLLIGLSPRNITCVFSPWVKSKIYIPELENLGEVHILNGLAVVDINLTGGVISKILEIRDVLGGVSSGEWSIVESAVKLEGKDCTNDCTSLFDVTENIRLLIHFGEMLQSFLYFKETTGIDYLLSDFRVLME